MLSEAVELKQRVLEHSFLLARILMDAFDINFPLVPSLRSSCGGVAHCSASLRCSRRVPVVPSVPSLRSSHDGVAHCFASSLAFQLACA